MEIFAGLSVCLLILVALMVTIKTFALWRRTRGLPELLLSLMLLCATVLGYPLAIASSQIPTDRFLAVHVGSQVSISLGFACLLLFTLVVFRAKTVWARCLVGFSVSLLVVGTAQFCIQAVGENPRRSTEMMGLTLLNIAPIAIAYIWTAFESLSYYRQLRLRLRLGLTEAVVVNRVLLWGLMCLAAGTAVVINTGAMLAGSFMTPLIVLTSSILGLIHAICLFVAFHPPAWYEAWLEKTYATETAG